MINSSAVFGDHFFSSEKYKVNLQLIYFVIREYRYENCTRDSLVDRIYNVMYLAPVPFKLKLTQTGYCRLKGLL